jgi:hypothetical protein
MTRSIQRRWRPAKLRWLAFILSVVVLIGAGTVAIFNASHTAKAAAGGVTLTVHQGQTTGSLNAGLLGISIEAGTITDTSLATGSFSQYLKTLDTKGILRVGGNSIDNMFWTSKGERRPSWARGTLTPADLTRLASLARESGWSVILGVNLKHHDSARAADEAVHAVAILGSSLKAIEIGNEPNYYEGTPAKLWTDYQSYRAAIEKAVPGVPLAAPEVARTAPTWLQDFTTREQRQGHTDLNYLTAHYYPACANDTPHPTIANLLSSTYHTNEQQRAQLVASSAASLKVSGLVDETNSVSCGGQAGVSDTYASALWVVDYSLLMAQAGVQDLNFHSGINGCSPNSYTPFCDPTSKAGQLQARPDYYGLLMVQALGTGSFLALGNSDIAGVRAYAVQNGSQLRLVLDNVAATTSVTVHLGASYTHGTALALTGPSLSATSGVMLGGATVNSNGTFGGGKTTAIAVSGNTLTISLPGDSAMLITLS